AAGRPVESDDAYEYRVKRVYVYGGYNLHFAVQPIRNPAYIDTGSAYAGGLEAALGFRLADTFRIDFAYGNIRDKWWMELSGADQILELDGHAGFVNLIFDAKLPAKYQMFRTSPLVPFAGFGAGFLWHDADRLANRMTGAYDLIAGVSVEINRTLALQVAYKYIKQLNNRLAGADYAPASHNVGAGVRLSF
ncbi:MAG: hypothetical protein LBB08_00400, partial [Rickettsiales bacterium]|nr:hypothetical protein [Rickettsiales bacterium]